MRYFVGMLAIVALVAGATVGAYNAWDRATHTRDDNGGVLTGNVGPSSTSPGETEAPAEGQVIVTGTVTAAHLEGVTPDPLAMPISVSTASRGEGGATITPVLVNGKSTSIEWSAGQPLPLEGDAGSLLLGPISADVTDTITLVLDGIHGFAPGTYKITTPVAVGSEPKDAVTFIATDKSTVQFRGTAMTTLDVLTTWGSGSVSLEGTLSVEQPDRSTTPVSTISLDSGAYRIGITPADGGGFNVRALLVGPTH